MFASKLEPTQFKEPLPPTPLVYIRLWVLLRQNDVKKMEEKRWWSIWGKLANQHWEGWPASPPPLILATISPNHHYRNHHHMCMYLNVHRNLPHTCIACTSRCILLCHTWSILPTCVQVSYSHIPLYNTSSLLFSNIQIPQLSTIRLTNADIKWQKTWVPGEMQCRSTQCM